MTAATPRLLAPRVTLHRGAAVDWALRKQLAQSQGAPFTYADVGSTRSGRCPDGFHALHRSADVGRGPSAFALLAKGIQTWQVQREAGLRVSATAAAKPGTDVALAKALGPVVVVLACRVVWALDEPRRAGFGYGTLPGHPESGEEAFLAELDAEDETVRFTVFGFSRPATLLSRIGAPIAGRVQRASIDGYLQAARRIAAG